MKKIFICDVDGVLIKGQTQKLLLVFLFRHKYISFFFFLKVLFWFLLYKLHWVHDVIRIRQQSFVFFQGWSKEKAEDLFQIFVQKEIIPRLNAEVLSLLHQYREKGYEVLFASATLMNILIPLKEYLGFGDWIGTSLQMENGLYTGQMDGAVPYGDQKLKQVEHFMREQLFSFDESCFMTDHISDLPLLKKVAYPMVFAPDSGLKSIAQNKGWLIYGV